MSATGGGPSNWLDLFWLPLGAGGHVMRWNGLVYEWLAARRESRVVLDLYHAGLMLHHNDVTYAIEMGPVWNVPATDRGVVCEGPVGTRWLGLSRLFRYEVRCWAGGQIPDIAEAVDSPVRTTEDPRSVQHVLTLLRAVPPLTWGRDELGAGEMWNSNSMVAWVPARSGHDMDRIRPPRRGRAPGWEAGDRSFPTERELVAPCASCLVHRPVDAWVGAPTAGDRPTGSSAALPPSSRHDIRTARETPPSGPECCPTRTDPGQASSSLLEACWGLHPCADGAPNMGADSQELGLPLDYA